MSLLGLSATSTSQMGFTASYLNQLIRNAISVQRKPIDKLNSQKDQLNIKKAVYSDLKNKLSSLKNITKDIMDNGSKVFGSMKVVSSSTSVVTATVKSSAVSGNYEIYMSNLAVAHSVRSDKQDNSTEGLNLIGKFTLNGVAIDVKEEDSLEKIMKSINEANYDNGKGINATIIDNHLVLRSVSTGTSHSIIAEDVEGSILAKLGITNRGNFEIVPQDAKSAEFTVKSNFKTVLQEAKNAEFTVNGIKVTRESNTGIDDVIKGVTLNLLSENGNSTVKVSSNQTDIHAKVSAFVYNFNNVMDYLNSKTRTVGNQDSTTYMRGTLSGDTVFLRLKMDLTETLRTQILGEADAPKYLADVGIKLGSGLKLYLSDSDFYSALDSNLNGVMRVINKIMEQVLDKLETFTTINNSSNMIDKYINSIDTKIKSITNQINESEKSLKRKEEALIKQYSALYMQNAQFAQDQYSALSIYSFSTKV